MKNDIKIKKKKNNEKKNSKHNSNTNQMHEHFPRLVQFQSSMERV